MEYIVLGTPQRINFGATGIEEVLQNIRMILLTPIFSVPLDREFGTDWSMLDNPMPMAQAKIISQIFAAIRKYEPRAEVMEIDFVQDMADVLEGRIVPRVVIGEILL